MGDRYQLFIGRLSKDVRTRELEDIFSRYGKLSRCEIKHGAAVNYAFVDYEDRRDAEDAIHEEDGREMHGGNIVVEWSKGPNYKFRPGGRGRGDYGGRGGYDDDRGGGRQRRRSSSRDRRRRSRSRSPRRGRSRSRSRSRSRKRSRTRSSSSRSR